MSGTPERKAWNHMKERCYDTKCHAYPTHGGRGIRVCDRWLTSFVSFLVDMGHRPTGNLAGDWRLDRIDKDGDYTPENCRWGVRAQTDRGMWKRRARSENHHHAKLTEDDVRMLRSHLWTPDEKNQFAERFGITVAHIRKVIRRQRWTHI